MTTYEKLLTAEVVCRDCGDKYGKYSVGCSSMWLGTCDVCDEHKPVTEVRDWGYLTKGMKELRPELKERIKEQSKQVAEYMKSQESTLTEEEVASYEKGEIACMFTEGEITVLRTVLEDHIDDYPGEDFEKVAEKITTLYGDYCVRYELSPALKKFHELYGTFGTENEQERAKWAVFRDAFHAGADHAKETA